ncbi:MAG: DUF995 domain-containing protein [Thiohalobacterales bacterium]
MRSAMILAGLLAAALGTNSLCAAEKTLTGDEVKAQFSGKTVDYNHVTRGFRMSVFYEEDGSMRGMRDGNTMRGSWRVNDKGELCIEYGEGDRCRHIVEKDGEYRKYKEENGKKIHIVTYHTFTDGNPNNY